MPPISAHIKSLTFIFFSESKGLRIFLITGTCSILLFYLRFFMSDVRRHTFARTCSLLWWKILPAIVIVGTEYRHQWSGLFATNDYASVDQTVSVIGESPSTMMCLSLSIEQPHWLLVRATNRGEYNCQLSFLPHIYELGILSYYCSWHLHM